MTNNPGGSWGGGTYGHHFFRRRGDDFFPVYMGQNSTMSPGEVMFFCCHRLGEEGGGRGGETKKC